MTDKKSKIFSSSFSSGLKSRKKFYVTTAIDYVNYS